MHRRRFLRSSALATLGLACTASSSLALASSVSNTLVHSNTTFRPTVHNGVSAQWIGHSTVLFHVGEMTILCDPVLFQEIGMQVLGTTVGIRRYSQPALSVDQIPCPDIVLLSHAHMDHTDRPTLEALCARFPDQMHCICAAHTKDVVEDLAWKSCRELDWWDSISIGAVTISAIEVLHNGWRYPWEPDRRQGAQAEGRSYNGYLISGAETNLVFAGDTTYCESFRDLRHIPIHLACMPIGAYMGCSDNHCTPEQAMLMATMMHAQYVAPMHCLTFHQTPEIESEPMTRFLRSVQRSDATLAWNSIGMSWTGSVPLADRKS